MMFLMSYSKCINTSSLLEANKEERERIKAFKNIL